MAANFPLQRQKDHVFEPPEHLCPPPAPVHSSSYAALCESVALIKMPPASVQSEVTNISTDSCLKHALKKKKNFISIDVGGEGRRGRN